VKNALDKNNVKKPVTTADVRDARRALTGPGNPVDQARAARGLGLLGGGGGISDKAMESLIKAKPTATPAEREALDRYIRGDQLNADDKALLRNLQDRTSNPELKTAVAQMNRDIRDQEAAQDAMNSLAGLLQGGGGIPLVPGGGGGGIPLVPGGGGGIPLIPGGGISIFLGGGILPEDPGYLPPLTPTCWIPTGPPPVVDVDVAYPTGPGIAMAITSDSYYPPPPPPVPGGGEAPPASSEVIYQDSAALDATTPFNTRYLRVANGTETPVTIYVLANTENAEGKMEWFPAGPESGAEAIKVQLEPGETADLIGPDNWRVNAQRVRIWGESQERNWLTFKDVDLWLVPETDEGGNHAYLSDQTQVFHYTLR
jgi:hypothetical protein